MTSTTYDGADNLLTQTNALGQVTKYTYDALNRVQGKTFSDPSTPAVFYVYDQPDAANGVGRLTTIRDGAGTTAYQYDKLGRVSATTSTIDSISYTTQTSFDAANRLDQIVFPDGEAVRYAYDAQSGLLESVNGASGYVLDITYDAQGRKTGIAYGNKTRTDYVYGNNHRLQRILTVNSSNSAELQNLTYVYDKTGNMTQVDDSVDGYRKTFAYDELDRLVQATGIPNSPVLSWQYDSIGNMTFNSKIGSYTYGQNGAGPHAVTTAGANSYTYDATGNMLSGPGRTFFYDQENRLILSIIDGTATNYTYDHSGQRVKQRSASNTITYVNRGYEVHSGATTYTTKHIVAGDQRVASITNDVATYYLTDQLGSSNVMTDAAGQVVQRVEYAPFGQVVLQSGQDATAYKFTGKELDESGLMYYGARYYDPVLCRFTTADTVVSEEYESQELNRYTYVRDNPIDRTDPTGHGGIGSFLSKVVKAVTSAVSAAVSAVKNVVSSVAKSVGSALTGGTVRSTGPSTGASNASSSGSSARSSGGSSGGHSSGGGGSGSNGSSSAGSEQSSIAASVPSASCTSVRPFVITGSLVFKAGWYSISTTGTESVTIGLPDTMGVVLSWNDRTGDSSWGVSVPLVGTLKLGGRGDSGANNFASYTPPGRPVDVSPSLSISLPSRTRSGMTSAGVWEPVTEE